MRYCINCGSPMGEERFCNQCGTDNGEAQKKDQAIRPKASEIHISSVNVSFLMHIVSTGFFIIAALILFTLCCERAEFISVQSMLYTGRTFFAAVYFVIGMWSLIPSLLFLINIKKMNSTTIVGFAIIVMIMMIAICILSTLFAKSGGILKFINIVMRTYKTKAVIVIVLEVVSIISGIFAPAMSK